MKMRQGFVSNSSSSSYVVVIKSKDIKSFLAKVEWNIDDVQSTYGDEPCSQITDEKELKKHYAEYVDDDYGLYKFIAWTSMYNGFLTDFPEWIRYIIAHATIDGSFVDAWMEDTD